MRALLVLVLAALLLAQGGAAVAQTPDGTFSFGTVIVVVNPNDRLSGASPCFFDGERFGQFPAQVRGDGQTRFQITLPQLQVFDKFFGGLATVTLPYPRSSRGRLDFVPGGIGYGTLENGKRGIVTVPGSFNVLAYRLSVLDDRLVVFFRFKVIISPDASCDIGVTGIFAGGL